MSDTSVQDQLEELVGQSLPCEITLEEDGSHCTNDAEWRIFFACVHCPQTAMLHVCGECLTAMIVDRDPVFCLKTNKSMLSRQTIVRTHHL